ncbi:hypothetical protein SCP_1202390 [Sparassis crispa]|uniref:Uncharacterized protein n=1 Tax=Sparassis crispa TaxID=139825 RepID=A0A401H0T9_9APHY|nr:hypothetical protein SCP_1202390 [Sparassis crispa]GBE88013.1 hypothetical protein SCP_1202390 [Sparassis crispa]
MYKRVEKRLKKHQKEEELGLNDEMKEVLGMHDTDSDESSSGESHGGDSDGDDFAEDTEGIADGHEDEDDLEGEQDTDDDLEEDDEPPMSIAKAVVDPIYTISLEPKVQACLVCPGKLLKNRAMTEIHRKSHTHIRRHSRFIAKAGKADSADDPRSLLHASVQANGNGPEGELSRRAQKRKLKQSVIRAKREKQKVMRAKAKAHKDKKAASAATIPRESTSPKPQKKKRKTEGGAVTQDILHIQPTVQPKVKTQITVQKISREMQPVAKAPPGKRGTERNDISNSPSKRREDGKQYEKSRNKTVGVKRKRPRSDV